MKIEEVFSLIENPDDWQSQVDVDKMWDIIRNNPTKRRELEPFRLDRETDKPYAELGQLQKDLFKTMLSKTMWRILKAQRTQPSARNLQREIEHLNRRIGVSEEGMEEDAKDDPHAANTEVANANPAQAPKAGNPAQAGTAPTAGATVPTVGKPGDPAKSAASNMQRIAANATGQTAAAQQALAGAKETVPVLPSDRTKAQQDKLDAAKEKVLGLGLDNALGESQMESDDPAIGDVVIMELANGRAIHAHVAETRGRSLVLALDETAMQWLEEAPDHEHLKITGSGMVSPVAKVWNSMIDDLEYDTPEGWAAMFRARTQDKESARKWGRLWRQQHINLGDDLSLDDQRAWEQAVSNKLHEMDQGLEEKAHVIAKSLNSKDRVLTKIYMDARRNGTPLKKYSQELAVKAGMPIDHYWNKIKPLVNEEELNEADAHVMLWPVIERVLGRKLYKGKNAADLYSSHTDHGIEIHGAVTRGLTGNEELELEQALHKAGIPIERVKIEPDMIRIDLRGEMDEAMPDVLGMSEDTSDPYSTQTKYYIVRKNAGLNAIPGKSGSHTMAAARKELAKLPDHQDYEIRAINTTKIPKKEPQPELDEGLMDTLKILALLGLGAYGINATLDSMNAPSKTPLGKALTVAAQHGDKSAAKYLANLDSYIEANDTNTLSMLKDSYLDGPKAAVKEARLHELNLRDPKYDYIDHGPWQIIVSKKPVVMGSITGPNAKYVAKAILKKDSRKQHIGVGLTQNGAIEDVSAKAVDLNRASLDPDDYENYVIDFNVDFTREYMDPKTGHFFKFEKGDDGAPRLISAGPDWYAKFGKDMEQLGFRKASNKTGHKQESQIPTYSFPIGKPKVKELGFTNGEAVGRYL